MLQTLFRVLRSIAPTRFVRSGQGCIQDAHDFSGTVGHGQQSAPSSGFCYAKAVLSVDVGADVIFCANQQHGEDMRIVVVEVVEVEQ